MVSVTGIVAFLSYMKSGKDAIDVLNQTKILPFFTKAITSSIDKKKLNEELKNYFDNQAKNNSYLNTIVFQNEPKFIQDIYVPLTLERHNAKAESFTLNDEFNIEKILAYNKILIVDYAGMGKSTCSKWLYLNCLSSLDYMPFLIELRNLNKNKTISNLIQDDLNLKYNLFTEESTNELLSNRKVVFFLDGLDEIDGENRAEILAQISKFHTKYSQAIFIMTSRPEEFLLGIKGFIHFKLKEFNKGEAFSLIKKYDPDNRYADKIIFEIEKTQNDLVIKEFLGNPLSISLLFTSYCYTPQLTFSKVQFYDNIFEALYERHDFSKGEGYFRPKFCTLNKNDFLKILCRVGMETCLILKKVSFSYAELCEVVENSKKYFSIDFDTDLFVKDLKKTVPLIVEDGSNLKWSHKSFQDYYTAFFLRFHYEKKFDVLKTISSKSGFYTVLDFYYDLDENGYKKHLLKDELKKLIKLRDIITSKVNNKELANNLANIFRENTVVRYYSSDKDLPEDEEQKKINKIFHDFETRATAFCGKKVVHQMASLFKIKSSKEKALVIYYQTVFYLDFSTIVRLAIRKNPKLEQQLDMFKGLEVDDLSILEQDALVELKIDSFKNATDEHLKLTQYILSRNSSLNFDQVEVEYKNILEIEKNEKKHEIKI